MTSTSLEFDVRGVPSGSLHVLRLEGEEEVSKPFHFDILFSSDDSALDVEHLLGAPCTLTIRQGSARRTVTGCLLGVEEGEQASDGAFLYRASLGPRLGQLASSQACLRLNAGEDGLERAVRLVREHARMPVELRLARRNGADGVVESFGSSGPSGPGKPCALPRPDQSDLEYLLELFAGERVEFVVTADGASLVIVDSVDAMPDVPGDAVLRSLKADESDESIPGISRVRRSVGGASSAVGSAAGFAERWRSQGHAVLLGESRLCTLAAGHRFDLRGHVRDELNREYVLVKVSHRAEPGPEGYRCTLEAAGTSAVDKVLGMRRWLSGPGRAAPGAALQQARQPLARRAESSLPLEMHLIDVSNNAFTDADTRTNAIGPWARVYVPGTSSTPDGYYRWGDVPSSTSDPAGVDASFQQTALGPSGAPYTWPNPWPNGGTLSSFAGAFLYTNRNTFEYASDNRYLVVGTTTTATAPRAQTLYSPVVNDATHFTLPGFLTGFDPSGNVLTTTVSGNVVDASGNVVVFHTDREEIRGSRSVKVYDLLVEDVRGDNVNYVAGNRFEWIRGHQNQEVYGDNHNLVTGKTYKVSEDTVTNTYEADVSNNYFDSVTNNYTTSKAGTNLGDYSNDYNANYFGTAGNTYYGTLTVNVNADESKTVGSFDMSNQRTSTNTVHGADTKITYGMSTTLRMGGVFDLTLGMWVSISVSLYIRVINSRVSLFMLKIDYVSTLKVDAGLCKYDGYQNQIKRGNLGATAFLAWLQDTTVIGRAIGVAVESYKAGKLSTGMKMDAIP